MARGNWEDSEVHTDGSKGIVAQQQRIMQQQSVMQQRLEVAHKDQLSNGGLASNDGAPSIFESPSPPIDYGWHGATLPCHPSVQQQKARQQPQNARLQAQQQHQAQLQQHIAQDLRLQRDQQDQAHEQAERYQRQRLGQAPIDSMDLQHPENRTHNNRVVLPATTARYVKHNLPKVPNNLAYDFGTASTIPQTNHSDKPTKPVDLGSYTQPFLSFISENPTVFHAVASVAERLKSQGFKKLSERDSWTTRLNRGGKYFFERNGSSLIAFVVGEKYESGDGASVIASHIDALATRLKPISTLSTKAGYVQLGVAPYAGALNNTWWDRDLGIGGRVLVKDSKTGKIESKLVKLGWPIARIPTLAPHFGAAANLSNPNKETEMVPIIGLDSADSSSGPSDKPQESSVLGGAGTFTATQPERLVKAIAREMNIQDCELLTVLTCVQRLTIHRQYNH